MRGNYQEMAARRLITLEELEEKLGQLEESRVTAERELTVLKGRRQRIEQLERDKDVLLESYAGMAPDALNSLVPDERHRVFKMLKLRVAAYPDTRLEVDGILAGGVSVCHSETLHG
jgi:flagellar motility protein MotE (MotC chaperone)